VLDRMRPGRYAGADAAGAEAKAAGAKAKTVGVEAKTVGVEAKTVGVEAKTAGVEAKIVGEEAKAARAGSEAAGTGDKKAVMVVGVAEVEATGMELGLNSIITYEVKSVLMMPQLARVITNVSCCLSRSSPLDY
jgi:hypothetical protein